ncbi:glycosyltransferase [Streptomyces sp. NPDC001665]
MTEPTPRFARIALVSAHTGPLPQPDGPDPDGQSVYVAQLAGCLAARGHDVTVYTRRDRPDRPTLVRTASGVKVVHVPAGPPAPVPRGELLTWMPDFGAYLARIWRLNRPDVVHAHFWTSGAAALTGARNAGIPVVQTFHTLGATERRHRGGADAGPPERVDIETRIAREVHRTIATCADEVNELLALGVPRTRITVVPCGVDTAHYAPVPLADRPPGAAFRLLSVGRLDPRQGFDRAVEALAGIPGTELLLAGGPDAPLLFADPEAERLRRTALRHGVADRVRLLGHVPRALMPHLMSSADLLVSLPDHAPSARVPIEAMACGTPVVATAVGGQLDAVVDGVTGTLVPPAEDDAHDLAATVRGLLGDPARLARYGAAARTHALARFAWDEVADGICRVYGEIARAPRVRETGRLSPA